MLSSNLDTCFYEDGKSHVYDFAIEKIDDYTNEKYFIGQISKKTLSELQQTMPNMKLISFDEFEKIHDSKFISAPEKTTGEQFYDAFECLPPIMKSSKEGDTIFAMCEYLSGTITRIYAKVNGEYWTMADHAATPSSRIYEKIEKAKSQIS